MKKSKHVAQQLWWLKEPEKVSNVATTALSERLKFAVQNALGRRGKASRLSILQDILTSFTGFETVDASLVAQVLEETREEHPRTQEAKTLRYSIREGAPAVSRIHTIFSYYLASIGRRLGFDVWINEKEQKRNIEHPDGQGVRLDSLCTVDLEDLNVNMIGKGFLRQFDVLWCKDGEVLDQFEVEPTMQISTQMVENSNRAIEMLPDMRRFLVVPRDYEEGKLYDYARNAKWGYWDVITFDNLERYFRQPNNVVTISGDQEKAYQVDAKIVAKEELAGQHYKLKLRCPKIEDVIRPGQFLHILCGSLPIQDRYRYKVVSSEDNSLPQLHHKDEYLLLRRPFSVHRVYYKNFYPKFLRRKNYLPNGFINIIEGGKRDGIDVLFKLVGKGTEFLSRCEPRQQLNVMGPLGKGFQIKADLNRAVLVAGGTGLAPLYALAEALRWKGKEVLVLIGALSKQSIPLSVVDSQRAASFVDEVVTPVAQEFVDIGADVLIATEGVEKGTFHGQVTQLLLKFESRFAYSQGSEIFACGPQTMLAVVARIAQSWNVPCQVLMEERMGCGIGACLSCVIKTFKRNHRGELTGESDQKLVCVDGPVFDAEEVDWKSQK